MKKRLLPSLAGLLLVAGLHGAQAGPLNDAFEQARKFDPMFQSARSERDANLFASRSAGVAYFPQFQANSTRLEMEANSRETYTITQPLISADRYATAQEAGPREQLAGATFQAREQDLSQRLMKAAAELLRQTEALRLNKAKIDALEKQSLSAKRAYELGQGTITDQRDAQVRLDQARAETLTLEAQIGAAQRQLGAITGEANSPLVTLRVPRTARALPLNALDEYVSAGLKGNPQLLMAQQNQRLAELAVTRADGVFLPTVSAVWTNTTSNNVNSTYSGVSVSLPLQAGSYYQAKGAAATANKQQEQTRDAELRTRLEVQRLWALVNAGRTEVSIRLDAIKSAELSVEANERSFKGGVRSQIDVLNSIQILFQVQQDYVNAVLALTDNYLNLLLQAATPTGEAVALAQNVLFPAR